MLGPLLELFLLTAARRLRIDDCEVCTTTCTIPAGSALILRFYKLLPLLCSQQQSTLLLEPKATELRSLASISEFLLDSNTNSDWNGLVKGEGCVYGVFRVLGHSPSDTLCCSRHHACRISIQLLSTAVGWSEVCRPFSGFSFARISVRILTLEFWL